MADEIEKFEPIKPAEVKRMSIKEFRELGYIQEINRLMLHPMGLALEVTIEEDGSEVIKAVWDCQDQEEGILFDPTLLDPRKADRVHYEMEFHGRRRKAILGFLVQPYH